MAYGKNKDRKDWSYRALPLVVGRLTGAKLTELALLQAQVLELMREMALTCFSEFPLIDLVDNNTLDTQLINLQKSKPALNSVWCEQARMRVKPALEHINTAYFKRLAGSLRYADSVAKIYPLTTAQEKKRNAFIGPQEPTRHYIHVPVSMQADITAQELTELTLIGATPGVIDWFKGVLVEGKAGNLSANQLLVVQDIYARTQAKHVPPEFGAKDSFTLQLNLDYRMLPSVKQKGFPDYQSEALELRDGEAYFLKDSANITYRRFLDIAAVKPRGKRTRIPVTLSREMSRRLDSTVPDFATLTLELTSNQSGELSVGVRLVCAKTKPVVDLTQVTAIVGRDFGYSNSISLSVAIAATPIDLSTHTNVIRAASQEAAKAFFQTHTLPSDVKIIERVRFSGKNFLKQINARCTKIDHYKSKIDNTYNDLDALKAQLFNSLNLLEGDLIYREQKDSDPLVKQFFVAVDLINDLKKARRAQYAAIKGLKKSWFGFLNNQEVKLAKKYQAVIVREDLTVEAIENNNPDYKGVVFNKMINNGSKGQYQDKAANKHAWNGIPELIIGSWYTSRACIEHAIVVDKKHRKGEKIYLPCCGKHAHADEHAADTIASYLFLRPCITRAELP